MKIIIRLIKYARPWAWYLVAATAALFVVTGINLYAPFAVRQVISIMESGRLEEETGRIVLLSLLLLGLYALRAAGQFVSGYFGHVASWRMVARVRAITYEHLQKLSMNYYHNKQTGQLMSRVVSDVSTFESLVAHAIPDVVTNVLTFAGVLVILGFIDWRLMLLICAPLPFITFMSIVLRRIRRYFRKGQAMIAELNAVLQDNFSGIKEIQAFNKQEYELGRVSGRSEEHSSAIIRALFFSGILNPVVNFITSAGTVIVLIAGPILALKTDLSISDVVAFLLYINLLYAPVSTLTRVIEDMQQALAGAERVFEVLDTDPDIKDKPGAKDAGRLSGQLSFNGVEFAYEKDMPILGGISFDINPGGMLAIIGPTGVGKTTISGLIARFYDPDAGSITMDGIDTRDMTVQSLRGNLSLVLQDVFLFNGTLAENIAYGCAGATRADIERCARVACIDKYIETLPEKYDTVIGERGVRLSGGQKQRISIARAILRDSPILILDEATSAVDAETEREIQNALNKIAGTRTLIVIAHRLSTVRRADKIIVLENGKITESGRHEELAASGGTYAELCRIQGLEL